eukprot:960758-Rhodomonas_salina.3
MDPPPRQQRAQTSRGHLLHTLPLPWAWRTGREAVQVDDPGPQPLATPIIALRPHLPQGDSSILT